MHHETEKPARSMGHAISKLAYRLAVAVTCVPCQLEMVKLIKYRKIPKISPRTYIFQRPFLRGLFLEGLIYGGKFAFQNQLGSLVPFLLCFTLYLRAISKTYKPPGGLIFGGAI